MERPCGQRILVRYDNECNWIDAMISDRSVLVCEVPLCPQRVRFSPFGVFCVMYFIRLSGNNGG